jgi:hypothetical protein
VSRGYDLSKLGFSQQLLSLIPDPALATIPYLNVAPFTVISNWESGDGYTASTTNSFVFNLTKLKGNHSLRFGPELRIYRESRNRYNTAISPQFTYSASYTKANDTSANPTRGGEVAAMLLGIRAGSMSIVDSYVASNANPFPTGLIKPARSAGGLMTNIGQNVSFFPESREHPYAQRWSLGLQRELPMKLMIEMSYVGNRNTRLNFNRELSGPLAGCPRGPVGGKSNCRHFPFPGLPAEQFSDDLFDALLGSRPCIGGAGLVSPLIEGAVGAEVSRTHVSVAGNCSEPARTHLPGIFLELEHGLSGQVEDPDPADLEGAGQERPGALRERQGDGGTVGILRRLEFMACEPGIQDIGGSFPSRFLGEAQFLDPPPQFDGGEETGRSNRFPHPLAEPPREARARLIRRVVVLPDGDVSRAACEVDLKNALFLLESLTGRADEVARDAPVATKSLRMSGIVMQPDQRSFAGSQRDGFEERVDSALGQSGQLGPVPAGAETGDELAVLHDAALGSDPLDTGAARACPVKRDEARARFGDRTGNPIRYPPHRVVTHLEHGDTERRQQPVAVAIDVRCRVLMDGLQCHVARSDARCRGDPVPEEIIGAAADTAPVDGTENVSPASVIQNHTLRPQGVLYFRDGCDPDQGLAQSGCDIATKGCQPQPGLSEESGTPNDDQDREPYPAHLQ